MKAVPKTFDDVFLPTSILWSFMLCLLLAMWHALCITVVASNVYVTVVTGSVCDTVIASSVYATVVADSV